MRDQLDGGAGNDSLYGYGGDDRLWGDRGEGSTDDLDRLFGGKGNDSLLGGRARICSMPGRRIRGHLAHRDSAFTTRLAYSKTQASIVS
ncbi:MAG: hypothetical protein U1D30_13890 [Planctomycetota bacterium]